MVIDSITSLVDALGRHRLLEQSQHQELTQILQKRFLDPGDLATELLDRSWLTSFQVDEIFEGRAAELVLGSYVLLERLSKGSVGSLYMARHNAMKRTVALQTIREKRLHQPKAVQRFYREIQAVSRLKHPNLVHVFDVDCIDRTHFFVMEYVDCINLEKLVHQFGPLPVERACEFIRQTALALQHAYEQRLCHHDLQPANVLITRRQNQVDTGTPEDTLNFSNSFCGALVKIQNLGLTCLSASPAKNTSNSKSGISKTSWGSPDYAAPEPLCGDAGADIRANLFSLGCIFYYLLAGRPPFPAGTTKHGETGLRKPPPSLEQVRSETPPEVAGVVHKLMGELPQERYRTPADLAMALSHLTGREGSATGQQAPPSTVATKVVPRVERSIVAPVEPPVSRGPNSLEPTNASPIESFDDDVITRHRQRLRSQRRRLLLVSAVSGAILFVSVGVFISLIARETNAPAAVDAKPQAVTPAKITYQYVKKKTREDTILATLEANHFPTLQGKWHLIGPFDNVAPDMKGFDIEYPPEKEIDLAKTYPGKEGKLVGWKDFPEFGLGRIVDLKRFPGQEQWACVYLCNEIETSEEVRLPVSFGSDDTLTVWLNGIRLVSSKTPRGAAPNQDRAVLELKPGKNRLLIKVCQGDGDWAVYVMPQFPPALDDALGSRLRRDF